MQKMIKLLFQHFLSATRQSDKRQAEYLHFHTLCLNFIWKWSTRKMHRIVQRVFNTFHLRWNFIVWHLLRLIKAHRQLYRVPLSSENKYIMNKYSENTNYKTGIYNEMLKMKRSGNFLGAAYENGIILFSIENGK